MGTRKGHAGICVVGAVLAAVVASTTAEAQRSSSVSSELGGAAADAQPKKGSGTRPPFSGLKKRIQRERATGHDSTGPRASGTAGRSGNARGAKAATSDATTSPIAQAFNDVLKQEIKRSLAQRGALGKSDKMFEKVNEIVDEALKATWKRMGSAVKAMDLLVPDPVRERDESLPCLGASDPLCE